MKLALMSFHHFIVHYTVEDSVIVEKKNCIWQKVGSHKLESLGL